MGYFKVDSASHLLLHSVFIRSICLFLCRSVFRRCSHILKHKIFECIPIMDRIIFGGLFGPFQMCECLLLIESRIAVFSLLSLSASHSRVVPHFINNNDKST